MKPLVDLIFNEEYSAEEKKRLGIPSNAVSKGGKWYVGDKYVGKVVDKKFVRVQQPKKTTTPKKSIEKVAKKEKTPIKSKSIPQQTTVTVEKGEPLFPWHVPNPGAGSADQKALERRAMGDRLVRFMTYAQSLGLSPKWNRPLNVVKEAQLHQQQISKIKYDTREDKQQVLADVSKWTADRIFDRPTKERQQVYKTIDGLIDQADLRVNEVKELYRGLHFANENVDYAKRFIKMIISGGTIELPPSGFTTTFKIAMDYAYIGDPQVSIILRALPPEKGFRAIHLSEFSQNIHKRESEVATRSSTFQIMSILQQEARREKTAAEPAGRLINITYTVQLQQLEK